MVQEKKNSLSKEERLHGRNAVENLFKKAGSRSMVSFPLRVVYTISDAEEARDVRVRMLVSVPKKHFKRAVKRNRVKRQVREAYRKNKHSLCDAVAAMPAACLDMAFVWLDDELHSSADVEKHLVRLLQRMEERIGRSGRNVEAERK